MTTAPIEWNWTTEERFDDMLGAVPPAAMFSGGFLLGEPYDHNEHGQPLYQGFRQLGDGKYKESNRPMTVSEFTAEMLGVKGMVEA